MARLPPLNALKAFEASGRHLNFRLAAEEIGVTQGAVAQHVRGLEATLGVVLFKRLPRGLALTDEGRTYLAPIKRAFQMMTDATQELVPDTRTLTISATPTFAARWLVPRLGQFAQDHPDVQIKIDASNTLSNFQSDGVDIAVRQGRPPFGPGLVARSLFDENLFAVCSPKLLQGSHPLKTYADLEHHVLLQDSHGFWPLFLEKAFGGEDWPKSRTMNFNQTSLAIEAAVAGQGVALVSTLFVEEELASGALICPFALSVEGLSGFYSVHPRKPRNSELVSIVRSWLNGQCAEYFVTPSG